MLLDNHLKENPRLKRHQKFYEWVTYAILLFTYLLTYLHLGVVVNRFGINLLFFIVGFFTVFNYRVLPFENRSGFFKYTVKEKFFSIQISDHLFGSVAIFLTGGIYSPFWYISILALLAGSMALPAWAIVVAGIESISLYLLTVAFITPYFTHLYPVGFSAQMVVFPLVAVFAVLLTYIIARDLGQEVEENYDLAESLKKKATEAMGERDKLNTIVKSVNDGIIVFNREREISFANKAASKILQTNQEEMLNKKISDLFNLTDNKGEPITDSMLCPLKPVTEDEVVFGPSEVLLKNVKNETLAIMISATQIKEGTQSDIGSICVFTDISKEKELEEMKLDFVAMAAHELRTPITGIRGYLSIVLEEVTEKLTKEERGMIEKAFISTTNLAALVENLLSVSHIESHSLKLNKETVIWSRLVNEVVSTLSSLADQKQIKILVDLPKDLPSISVDKFRIIEVLSNLITNAITYSLPERTITVSAEITDGNLITHIKDQGEGIPEKALPHLFTKFFRVSGALVQGAKGTGLGLYISKSIIDVHRGNIWVESELGKGSTFSFSLPLKPSD